MKYKTEKKGNHEEVSTFCVPLKIIEDDVKDFLSLSPDTLMHTLRVARIAQDLSATTEKRVDLNILMSSCLLHDNARPFIERSKGDMSLHAKEGAHLAQDYLNEKKLFDKSMNKKIVRCIEEHSRSVGPKPSTIEAKILFDADKLDAFNHFRISRYFKNLAINNQGKSQLSLYRGNRIKNFTVEEFVAYFNKKLNSIADSLFLPSSKEEAERLLPLSLQFLQTIEKSSFLN